MNPFNYSIFIDCGAPSLYNRLSRTANHFSVMGTSFKDRKFDNFAYTETKEYRQYLDDYIEFLQKNKGKIDTYSNLDVINNPKKTMENQRILEAAGLTPIPVFHLGSDTKYLNRYLSKYEYIALGGLVPNKTNALIPILDILFKENLIDKDGFPKVKLHGFACTSIPLMLRYPWYSVDSTSCRKLANYGKIAFPLNKKERIFSIPVSSRSVPVEKRVTGEILRLIDTYCKSFHMTLSELSESPIHRMIWNYFVFSEIILRNVPAWPWSFTSRFPKFGATDYMKFYAAGSLSKNEEVIFWENVSKNTKLNNIKGRLQSFFYKNAAQFNINNKFDYENK